MIAIDPALLPLKRYADFSGRSTRTELVSFWLLTSVIQIVLTLIGAWIGLELAQPVQLVFGLTISCPWAAAIVRRLHDQNISGWWLALVLPAVFIWLWDQWNAVLHGYESLFRKHPPHVEMVAYAGVVVVFLLTLWKGTEGENRYGPNPRYDETVPY